ncbi:p-hydroxybenzoic acid efflux pump subunit AaeB [Kluyvera cryocrescens]|uniref:p-hydroxybenzoic acid efflux pump subunit AaeB n=1 Tax=Kluyvera cryocrescens TaxID=580 RepID=A0A485AGE1_KLUCR|nr:p-hydroxybenzoic acid efflux pump subunit AaeB [Kluyvera cryocrescens]
MCIASSKRMRRVLAWTGEHDTPVTIYSWVGAATRYLLLKRGVIGNAKISAREEEILQSEVVVRPDSAERHHAMINFWRTTVSCALGILFWLWTGWTSGSGAMVMIAVVTSLAMRLPNPAYGGDRFPLRYHRGSSHRGVLLPGCYACYPAKYAAAVPEPGGDVLLYRD